MSSVSVLQKSACLLNRVCGSQLQQTVRTTCVFRRMWPPEKEKHDDGFRKKLKRRHFVYILDECKETKPSGNMDVLLTADIDGVGLKGHVVNVSKRLARNTLLPSEKACYLTKENVEKVEKEAKVVFNPSKDELFRNMTLRQLRGMHLRIPMNPNHEWALTKTHVKVAFRKCGVELSEENLELPEEPITGPAELSVTVLVNKKIPVEVNATVFHYNFDKTPYPKLPPLWSKTKQIL